MRLRLRRPNNEWDFFPYDHILNTMLHELCHNEHGPHNADFYNLLDELRKVAVLLISFLNVVKHQFFYSCCKNISDELTRAHP